LAGLAKLLMDLYNPRERPATPPYQVSATSIGVLRTRTSQFWAERGPLGFGHLGAYPAELGVMGVKDIAISNVSLANYEIGLNSVGLLRF